MQLNQTYNCLFKRTFPSDDPMGHCCIQAKLCNGVSMKRVMFTAALGVAGNGAGHAAPAADTYDDTGAIYVAPMLQYTDLDTRRVSKDDFGYQVGVGYDFAKNFAAEAA